MKKFKIDMKKGNLKYFVMGVVILLIVVAVSFGIYRSFVKDESVEEINNNYLPVNEEQQEDEIKEDSQSNETQETEKKETIDNKQTTTNSNENSQSSNQTSNTTNSQNQTSTPKTNTNSSSSSTTSPNTQKNEEKKEEVKESKPVTKEEPKVVESKEKTETPTPTVPKAKVTCSDANSKWKAFKNEYQVSHKAKITLNRADGVNYGTKASRYGYGYLIDTIARNYSDDECTVEYWTTTIFVPTTTCGENDDIHIKEFILPYTENFISIFDYLNNLGYDCHDRSL